MKKLTNIILACLSIAAITACSPKQQASDLVEEFAEAATQGKYDVMAKLYPTGDFFRDTLNNFNYADLANLQIESITPIENNLAYYYTNDRNAVYEVVSSSKGKQIIWFVEKSGSHCEIILTKGLMLFDPAKFAMQDSVNVVLEDNLFDVDLVKNARMITQSLPVMRKFVKALESGDQNALRELYPKLPDVISHLPLGTTLNLKDCKVHSNLKHGLYGETLEDKRYYSSELEESLEPGTEYVLFSNGNEKLLVSPSNEIVLDSYHILSPEVEKNKIAGLGRLAKSQSSDMYDTEYILELKKYLDLIKDRNERAAIAQAELEEQEKRIKAQEAEAAVAEKERLAKVNYWKNQGAALVDYTLCSGYDSKGVKVSLRNLSNQTIKYMHLTVQGYNEVDDPVGSPKQVTGIGPLEPDCSCEWEFDDVWTRNPSIISYFKIRSMRIEYRNGKSKTINNPQRLPANFDLWYR